jgi:hypothetical protein
MFPATTRTFTKDTALSENARERRGMCELTRHGMGPGWVKQGMCELVFNV